MSEEETKLRTDLANAVFHIRKLIAIANESIEDYGTTLPEADAAQAFVDSLKEVRRGNA